MDYAYDPELEPMLEFLPVTTLDDPVATRAGFDSMITELNAGLDESGVTVQNRAIPGPVPRPQDRQ